MDAGRSDGMLIQRICKRHPYRTDEKCKMEGAICHSHSSYLPILYVLNGIVGAPFTSLLSSIYLFHHISIYPPLPVWHSLIIFVGKPFTNLLDYLTWCVIARCACLSYRFGCVFAITELQLPDFEIRINHVDSVALVLSIIDHRPNLSAGQCAIGR